MRKLNLVRSWCGDDEIHMSHFGYMYSGYFTDIDRCRQVGFFSVKEEFRGHGYFHALLERLKEKVHTVVLFSPLPLTIKIAGRHGYKFETYIDDKGSVDIMVWRR